MYQRRYNVTDVCLIYSSGREAIGMHRILRILWKIACRLERHAPTSFHVRIEMTGRMDLWTLFSIEIRKILISNNIHHPSPVDETEFEWNVWNFEWRIIEREKSKVVVESIGREREKKKKKKRRKKRKKFHLPPPISSFFICLSLHFAPLRAW